MADYARTVSKNAKRWLAKAQRDLDNAPARIKAADPVTFMDDTAGEMPIPLEMRADPTEPDVRFSVRTAPPPKNTGIGYKVFFQKNGKLYQPMAANPNGADTPVGFWLNADAAPVAGESKTGRPQVKQDGKGTQGGSGMLAYRPGWHLSEIPYALQFNRRDENGERTLFPADFVWAEVEFAADKDYQEEAETEGMTENGNFRHSYAGLKHLPTDGYYRYRTNPNPETDPWIITEAMKVNRILTKAEVDDLVIKAGRKPQRLEPRFSVRTAWRGEMKATAQTTRANIMAKYGDLFRKAKAGDPEAAANLIEKVVKPEKIRELVAAHPNASVVPVYAEESTGRNQLPRKYADYISALTGIEADTEIMQSVRAFHSESSADHRLFVQPEFDGPVKRGAEYIVIDDHITQGGTVNALRDHIESNGGKVVAIAALTLSQGSSILSPHKDTIDEIKHKWPDINRLLRAADIADRAEALTESQLRYILKFSPDTFRTRIAEAVEQGIARTQHETLGAPSQGVARAREDEYASMSDVNGRPAKRQSVRISDHSPHARDLATALIASRRLAGRDMKPEDANRILKNLGLADKAADVIASATALADANREKLRGMVERHDPELVATLARQGLANRLTQRLDDLITDTANVADPSVGAKVQQAIQSKQVRDLMNAHGFTAAQMMAELPVDLAKAIFAVAEYEKSPEKLARIEAARKKREDERAAEVEDEHEAAAAIDDQAYREPTADERAKLDALLDRARFMLEARKSEEVRKKLAKKLADEDPAGHAPSSHDGEGGHGEGADPAFGLPLDTVKRIAPVFESADLFASFLIEWTADHVADQHPNIPSTAEMWKNPVAVRELKQSATHILRKLAKDVLGSPSLNYARNFADHAINELESDAETRTYRAVRRKIARIYDQIHNHALSLSRRKMVKNLVKEIRKKAIERGRFSAVREDLKRKIDAKTEQWCRWLIPALTMSEEMLTEEINRLTNLVTVNPADEHATPEDNLREAADRLAVLHKYGGMARWMPGKIADAEAEIMQMLDGRRQEFEARREEALAKDKSIRDALINAVNAGAATSYRKHTKLGDAVGRYTSAMMGNLTLEMQHLIRYCTDPSLRQAALEAIEEMQTWISDGGSSYRIVLGQAQAELHEGLALAYGNAEAGIKHLLREKIPENAANAIFTQGKDRVPTYGNLLQLYASTIQGDYKDNAEKHGRTSALPLMVSTLTEADRKFHAWAVEWFKRNRQALSDSVEAVTGLPVTSPDALYTPVRILREKTGFDAEGMGWSPIPSALNRRIVHDLDFNEGVNFLACLQEQAEVRAQTIGYAEIGIRLRNTIAHHDVQAAVRKNVGKADMQTVTDHVRDVLIQNAARRNQSAFWAPLNAARRWMARFYLSVNIPSAVKQLASMPVWANALLGGKEVGLFRCLRYLATVATDEGRSALRELMASHGFKARYTMGWSEETQNVLTNPSKNRIIRYIERAYDKGMILNGAVDAVSCLWMAQGFYRDATQSLVDKGLPRDEAKQKAMALTWSVLESGQQSGRIENLNTLQRRGGAGVAAIFQFKTAYLLQNNYLIQAMREMRAGTPGARGRFLRALFINTVWIPAFVACIDAAWEAIMGEPEPPEDQKSWPSWFKAMCWSMIDGVTAPMFGLNSALHSAYDAMTNTKNWRQDSEIPALSGAIRVTRDAARVIYDLGKYGLHSFDAFDFEEELDAEKLGKDVHRLVRDLIAPYRHVSKAIENRMEE